MIQVSVSSGAQAGQRFEFDQDVVTVGRAPDNDVVLAEPHVSGHHLRIIRGPTRTIVEDLRSTRGTIVVRDHDRFGLNVADALSLEIDSACTIEIGEDAEQTVLDVKLLEQEEARVVSMRRIDEIGPAGEGLERDLNTLQKLYAVQKRLGGAGDLDDVLQAICDGTLELLPRATHVTVILRDDDQQTQEAVYVPVLTRLRGHDGLGTAPDGPVPIARSVFRKVLKERAAVLAADAPEEVAQVESIVGASIRSTAAVPLWRGGSDPGRDSS